MEEEGFVEGAVVDVDGARGFAGDAGAVFLFDGLFFFVGGGGVADGADAGFDDEVGELEGWFFDSSLCVCWCFFWCVCLFVCFCLID